MNFRPAQTACVLLLAWNQAAAGPSSWDETQLQLLQSYSTPLRWENIEGPPYWVSGPKPRHQFHQRRHLIHLQPGEEVTLRADANTWLRLVGEGKTLRQQDLDIGVSTDARLFADSAAIQTIDPYSLLIRLPKDKPALIRLTRPRQAASGLLFAAYLSRVEPLDTLAPYYDRIHLPGKTVRVRREGEAASQSARALEPGEDVEFSLTGPARLQLVAVLHWPRTEPRHEQSLALRITVDDTDPVPLLLCPELDARHRTRVGHRTELVSGRMNGFFSVPEGKHRVGLRASAPVYLSVFRQAHPDFLLPGLNGPATNAMPPAQSVRALFPEASDTSSNTLSPPWSAADLVTQEQAAVRLARDNQPRQAGAQAADWMNRLARSRPDYPAAGHTAATVEHQQTFYRDILPTSLPGGQPLEEALFAPNRLPPLFKPQQHLAVYNPTLEQVEGMLADGRFAKLPTGRSPELLYELPTRAYESELRIAATTSSSNRTHLLVQFDAETPVRVVLDPATALPEEELAASDTIATLRVLEQQVHLPTNLTSAQPVGEFDLPLPISKPGVIELPLPQHVRQVRIRAEATNAPVMISVAYRAARPFAFGEAEYRALLHQVGPAAAMKMLADPEASPQKVSESWRALRNHLLPLIRLLKVQYSDFAKSVDLASLPPHPPHPLDSETASKMKAAAQNLESEGQLIEATKSWNRLFWEGTAADQTEAALAIMRCLHSLDEDFLATQYARYVVLLTPGPQVPAPAVALLENVARQTDDTEPLQQLRSVLFLRCPCPRHLAGLAEALALNGQDELALSAGLILPADSRPIGPMLGAALHQNWWQTFDQLVEGLTDNDSKYFWRAQKHLAFQDFVGAQQELEHSNEKGREMLDTLQKGLHIREQLAAPQLKARLEGLLAWEQWQSHQPGPKTWETARDVLQECPATELLFNCEQNQFTTFLRAEPATPVKLCFLGPIRLRVEARPLLKAPFKQSVEDWLELVEDGITNRIPISQCVPNPSLELTSSPGTLVGVKTAATLEWGPGWHAVRVAAASHSALIQVQQEEPMLPTRILPTLNPGRMNLVLRGGATSKPTVTGRQVKKQSDLWWVPPNLARPKSLSVRPNRPSGGATADSEASANAGLSAREELRLALRLPPKPGRLLEYDSQLFGYLPPAEQWLATCRTRRWSEFTNWAALPDLVQANCRLATGRIQELLDSGTPRDTLTRLIVLLEISELFPAWREQAQCLAESLENTTNCAPAASRILFRLTRDRTWVPLKVSPMSAGLRPIEVPPDLPQAPSTRLRRALLPPAGTNLFTLSGQSEFTASMGLRHSADLRLHAELVRAGFSPLIPLTVSVQVDAGEVQDLALGPSRPAAETRFQLAEGPHRVRVWIVDPVVNQWVRIRLSGSSEVQTNSIWSQPLAEAGAERRFLYAATPTQPVRFSWRGPALLRVDEYRDGRFSSQVRLVPAGEQKVEIAPAPGRSESWYQVFVRETQTNRLETRVASVLRKPEPVPPPEMDLPETAPPTQVQLKDYYRLGGQEEGTCTPSVSWVHRRPFEITTAQNTADNEFFEANVSYRKVNPGETVWFKSEALGRVHRPGDLTFGLNERVVGRPGDSPFEWSWAGGAFLGTAGPQQQNVQWSLETELELDERLHLNRRLDWIPFAGLFARYLSLDPNTASQYNYIDQDLYTSFRNDHRWGGVLGNKLEYRPWLDTLLNAGVQLMSTQDFTPDNWGMRFSWTQLMGPIRAEAAYRFRQFLNNDTRSSASWLQGVSGTVYAEHWINGRQRIELGAQYRYDWPDSGNSYFIVLRWDFSQGRGYRDYSPREAVFRDLRSRRIPSAFNNVLQPGPPGLSQP